MVLEHSDHDLTIVGPGKRPNVGRLADRRFGTLSEGERKRTQIAPNTPKFVRTERHRAYRRTVTYFATGTSGFDDQLDRLMAMANEVRDPAKEEDQRQDFLSAIGRQATADATTAWNRGDVFFAPVLFQPLEHSDLGWETSLTQITQIGWHMDSWQVLGPAPHPFGHTVTLIQTLFTR